MPDVVGHIILGALTVLVFLFGYWCGWMDATRVRRDEGPRDA